MDYLYGVARLASTSAANPQAHVWYAADLQGSVRYTQDDTGSSGQSLTYDPVPPRYDPYGAIDRGADGDGMVAQPFAYRGELQDANTGLVYLRARQYNPALGQFLQRDPLEQQTGQAYAYAGDNPQTNADPTGMDWIRKSASEVSSSDLTLIRSNLIQTFRSLSSDPARTTGPVTQKINGQQVRVDLVQILNTGNGSTQPVVGFIRRFEPDDYYTMSEVGPEQPTQANNELTTFARFAHDHPNDLPSSVERILRRVTNYNPCNKGQLLLYPYIKWVCFI